MLHYSKISSNILEFEDHKKLSRKELELQYFEAINCNQVTCSLYQSGIEFEKVEKAMAESGKEGRGEN